MRFLQKDKVDKTVLVVSDLHLGAGAYVDNMRNYLEAFHYDKEFVDFIEYYSSGDYSSREVELIINGDFLDLLAVPFVRYFDDEYWSEEAALEKLRIILKAHPEVLEALGEFASQKKNKITYIIGNHDGEMILPPLQKELLSTLPEKARDSFTILANENGDFSPVKGVVIMHGHEYEIAHNFHPSRSIVEDENGKRYFLPPWGSYYVTRVINKFKEIRPHVDAVKPIKRFLINGLIYDTFFTIRFMIATISYFIMVRTIYFFKQDRNFSKVLEHMKRELVLFQDYESMTQDFIMNREGLKALIVGHTHKPVFRSYANGATFINTGTWMRMFNLDFSGGDEGAQLCFAQVDISGTEDENIKTSLNIWKGRNDLPFDEF